MAIRTKRECHETSLSQNTIEICETVPIIDWKLYLARIPLAVSNNPTTISQNIQVPELQYVYPGYTSFKFVMTFINSSPIQWCSVSSPKLNGTILTLNPGDNTDLTYSFQNLDLLDLGVTQFIMKCQAFGVKNGIETELSNENIEGMIEMSKTDNSGSSFRTNKEVFNLTYNLVNHVLAGDKEIIIYSKNNVGYEEQPFDLTVTKVENASTTSLFLDLNNTELVEAYYSGQMLLKADGKRKYVTINLNVVDDGNQFYINPELFDFMLLRNENRTATGVVTIDNPNNLTIEIASFPAFLSRCEIVDNQVQFTTKSANQLSVGLNTGNIILRAGEVNKAVFIRVNVIEHLVSDFIGKPYFFALDPDKVQITKVDSEAVKVFMKLEMFFLGYGEMYNEIQSYQLPYFNQKVTFYPGEEVNDFFVKQRAIQGFNFTFDAYQYASVKMTFDEVDASDNVLNSYVIDNVRFAPGYTPKCFPFFTDFASRRFFEKSRLAISRGLTTTNSAVRKLLSTINENSRSGYLVTTHLFNASVFPSNEISDFENLKFIPMPTPHQVVNIFWENHNLVFDWFSCVADFDLPKEFEHTISENIKSGLDEKFETKQTDNLSINTGWLLDEEIEVVDAIFNSNFVIIQLPQETVRAIPTTKKNNLKTSEDGFKSMMLEFKIIRDDR